VLLGQLPRQGQDCRPLKGAGILSWRQYAVFKAGMEVIAISKVFSFTLFSFLLLLDLAISCNTSLPLPLCLGAFIALLLLLALTL